MHASLDTYLRLSSILNILSVVSSSGKQEVLLDSLRLTGLPGGTTYQQRKNEDDECKAALKLLLKGSLHLQSVQSNAMTQAKSKAVGNGKH